MASGPDVRNVVDAFLAKSKTLAGVGTWQRDSHERSFRWVRPIELEGELPGFDLTVKAYPRSHRLKFRVVIAYGKAVWRIDYANDAPHINSIDRPSDLDLGPIVGPHYHSWEDNRRFARANSLPSHASRSASAFCRRVVFGQCPQPTGDAVISTLGQQQSHLSSVCSMSPCAGYPPSSLAKTSSVGGQNRSPCRIDVRYQLRTAGVAIPMVPFREGKIADPEITPAHGLDMHAQTTEQGQSFDEGH
jgi:hypothetical protein